MRLLFPCLYVPFACVCVCVDLLPTSASDADSLDCNVQLLQSDLLIHHGDDARESKLLGQDTDSKRAIESEDHCTLKVFVYEHMNASNSAGVFDNPCAALEAGSAAALDCVFGEEFSVAVAGGDNVSKLRLRNVDQFALGAAFTERLRSYACRTYAVDQADLFFLPIFPSGRVATEADCPKSEDIVQQATHLNAENAARHILIIPRLTQRGRYGLKWNSNICEYMYGDGNTPCSKVLASMTKIGFEDMASTHVTLQVPPNMHSIPYPSFGSGLDREDLNALRSVVSQPGRNRTKLATAIWGRQEEIIEGTKLFLIPDQRRRVAEQCVADEECQFLDTTHGFDAKLAAEAMLDSHFCMQPPGDSASRKGIVDSLQLGCIPVLLHPLQQELWPWHVKWNDVSIMLHPREPDVMGQLRRVPASYLSRLHAAIAALRLEYLAAGSDSDDAFSVTLQHVRDMALRPASMQPGAISKDVLLRNIAGVR